LRHALALAAILAESATNKKRQMREPPARLIESICRRLGAPTPSIDIEASRAGILYLARALRKLRRPA